MRTTDDMMHFMLFGVIYYYTVLPVQLQEAHEGI